VESGTKRENYRGGGVTINKTNATTPERASKAGYREKKLFKRETFLLSTRKSGPLLWE